MREQTANTDVATDPATITDGVFTKTSISITFACSKASNANTQIGLEILDAANVVIRRAVTAIATAAPLATSYNTTIAGLVAGTTYKCRGFRGDEGLAAL
jgi:hypothetical protein